MTPPVCGVRRNPSRLSSGSQLSRTEADATIVAPSVAASIRIVWRGRVGVGQLTSWVNGNAGREEALPPLLGVLGGRAPPPVVARVLPPELWFRRVNRGGELWGRAGGRSLPPSLPGSPGPRARTPPQAPPTPRTPPPPPSPRGGPPSSTLLGERTSPGRPPRPRGTPPRRARPRPWGARHSPAPPPPVAPRLLLPPRPGRRPPARGAPGGRGPRRARPPTRTGPPPPPGGGAPASRSRRPWGVLHVHAPPGSMARSAAF